MNSSETKVSSSAAGQAEPAAELQSSSNLVRAAVVIVVLIIIGLLVGLIPRYLHRKVLDSQTSELSVQGVRVVYAAPGKATASLDLPAEVRAFTEAPIYARASGYMKHWYVDIGAHVEAGQLLA